LISDPLALEADRLQRIKRALAAGARRKSSLRSTKTSTSSVPATQVASRGSSTIKCPKIAV
jgi:hypothetical protein